MSHFSQSFRYDSPLHLGAQLGAEEQHILEAARRYCEERLATRILAAFRSEATDPGIFKEWAGLDCSELRFPRRMADPPELCELWAHCPRG